MYFPFIQIVKLMYFPFIQIIKLMYFPFIQIAIQMASLSQPANKLPEVKSYTRIE
jgi:hypothetical protein